MAVRAIGWPPDRDKPKTGVDPWGHSRLTFWALLPYKEVWGHIGAAQTVMEDAMRQALFLFFAAAVFLLLFPKQAAA